MIESLVIENFRSWAGYHEIPLRPLTFLYGANSTGKSSLLVALSVLRQTLSAAAGARVPLIAAGPDADVGDFSTLVYGHDTQRTLTIGFSYRGQATQQALQGRDTLRRILVEFGLAEETASRGVVRRLSLEIGGMETLSFVAASGGFQMEARSAEALRGLVSLRPTVAASSPDVYAQALRYLTDRTVFHFVHYLPARAVFIEEMNDPDDEPIPGVNVVLLELYDAWALLCRDLAQELADALGHLRHLGPLRLTGSRMALSTALGDLPDDVGRQGEFIIHVLSSKELREEVNGWLQEAGYSYRVELGEARDSALGTVRWWKVFDRDLKVEASPQDVGVGISQSIPVVVQLLASKRGALTVLLEQPELHLHPRAHAALAQLMADVANEAGVQVICETHSEIIHLRIGRLLRYGKLKLEQVSVQYIQMNMEQEHVSSASISLPIGEKGLAEGWPDGFFLERLDEIEDLLSPGGKQ